MAIVLFHLAFLGLVPVCYCPSRHMQHTSNLRRALLMASVCWGVTLAVLTELLSFFKCFSYPYLAGAWFVLALVAIWFAFRSLNKMRAQGYLNQCTARLRPRDPVEAFIFSAIAVLLLLTAVQAWIAPPNNWDGMTYHMSRVVHWIQNKSVAPYATNILRQLYNPPWAEFVIAHVQILSGSDRWANSVQWFSMAGSLVAISLIARQFGAKRKEQLYAAFVSVTLPMGLLQATNVHNDFVATYWTIVFVYFLLDFMEGRRVPSLYFSASALALAFFSKATVYVYAFPFLCWFVVWLWKEYRKEAVQSLLIIALAVSVVNGAQWQRNLQVFGNLFGASRAEGNTIYEVKNETFGPRAFFSNVLRNMSLHWSLPDAAWSERLTRAVTKLHERVGINVNDPKTTFGAERHVSYQIPAWSADDDLSGNTLHFVLIVFALAGLVFVKAMRKPQFLIYQGMILSGFFLFCFIFKWQPWHSRMHLGFFVLLAPLVAAYLMHGAHHMLRMGVLLLLFVSGIYFSCFNQTRPLIGTASIFKQTRADLYFAKRPVSATHYRELARNIENLNGRDILLIVAGDSWEYPLWVLLGEEAGRGTRRIEHGEIQNGSRIFQDNDFKPDIAVHIALRPELLKRYSTAFPGVARAGPYFVFGGRSARWR